MATVVAELWEELDLDVEWVREKVDKARLIEDEVVRVKRFYTKHRDPAHGSRSVEAFVTRCFEAKESLINEWGGWWHHSDESLLTEMTVSDEELTQLQAELTNWLKKTYGDNHLLYKWNYDAQYGYEMPYPKGEWRLWPSLYLNDVSLWANRLFEGARAAKEEREFSYDYFHKVKIKPNQSVARAVLRQAKKDYKGAEEWVKVLERWCEMVGVYWSRRNTISLTLSCAPSTFLKLGHFSEGGSCFATSNASHKVMLAMAPRGFVGLVYRGNEAETKRTYVPSKPRGGAPAGRFWGFMVNGAAQVSNQYKLSWPVILPALKEVLKTLWGTEVKVGEADMKKENFLLKFPSLAGLYFNGDQNWLFSPRVKAWSDSRAEFEREFAAVKNKYLICRYCQAHLPEGEVIEYKGYSYHAKCLIIAGINVERLVGRV